MSAKSAYLLGILVEASSTFKWTIWALLKEYTSSSKFILKAATYTIKALYFELRAATAKAFFSINSTCQIVKNSFLVV